MAGAAVTVLAVLFLAFSAIAITYVLGVRFRSATVRDAARRFDHTVGNPQPMSPTVIQQMDGDDGGMRHP